MYVDYFTDEEQERLTGDEPVDYLFFCLKLGRGDSGEGQAECNCGVSEVHRVQAGARQA